MNSSKLIGQVLLWCGFLAAALVTVSRLEIPEQPWQTVPWGLYAVSMVVGAVGVVFLRRSAQAEVQQTDRVRGEFETLTTSLANLRATVSELRSTLEGMSPHEIVNKIDEGCVESFADFADARNALVQRFGLHGFAQVMTSFASAERFVNRAWSAAADGYVHEASSSLERAEHYLNEAGRLMSLHLEGAK